jgi:hypothetical protein
MNWPPASRTRACWRHGAPHAHLQVGIHASGRPIGSGPLPAGRGTEITPRSRPPGAEAAFKELEKAPDLLDDDGLMLELREEAAGDPAALAKRAPRDPQLLRCLAGAAAAAARRPPGFARLLGLPAAVRHRVVRLLLHAAACHAYAVESSGAPWPYGEPCAEPVFGALSLRQQLWLVVDVVATLAQAEDGAPRWGAWGVGG